MNSEAVDEGVDRPVVGHSTVIKPKVRRIAKHLHQVIGAPVGVGRTRPPPVLSRHDREGLQPSTDVLVIYERRVAGEFTDEAGVLLRIQGSVIVEEPRQYVLYECLNRLRLNAKLARHELSCGISQDGRLKKLGLSGGIGEVAGQERLGRP